MVVSYKENGGFIMLTQRLGSDTQKNPEFIDSLIKEIKAHPGCCDEVWFATDYGFPPLEKHKQSAAALRENAEKFRKAGIRVSLQLSNSIGHGQYMRSRDCSGLVSDSSKVAHMVGADGTVAGYCFCWSDKVFRDYTFTALKYYLEAVKPYRLWVDDDLRATNHAPVSHGCFCEGCIARFNKRFGTDFDREGLVIAINADIEMRKNYIEFIRASLYDYTYALSSVVHETLPDCRMGWQGCANGGYTGFGYDFLYDAMKNATGFEPSSRPGGGAYSDHSPYDFLDKASLIEYQNMMLPDFVTDKRPEIENLPDVVFGKSIAGTCFETTCYLIYGNTAMSYAMLMNDYEPMSWHGQMLGAFAKQRAYWERLSAVSKNAVLTGLTPFFPKTGYLAESKKDFDWSREEFHFADGLRCCALPVSFNQKSKNTVYTINGEIARRLNADEIEFLLTKPVVCDGRTIEILNQRGFIENITAKEVSVQERREKFTAHSINRGFENRAWGGQIWRGIDYELSGGELEIITEYTQNFAGVTKVCGIASAVFTTCKGAKWAVFGFDLWERTKSTEKRMQLLNACEYIGGSRFIAEILNPVQSCIVPACNKDGKTLAVSILNITVGKSGELKLRIDNPASKNFVFMSMTSPEVKLVSEKCGENSYLVTVPDIDGWSAGTVFCGK